LIPTSRYSGQKLNSPVASGTTPIHAHTGPPVAAHAINATPADPDHGDAAHVRFHGVSCGKRPCKAIDRIKLNGALVTP
jgi:hypothetical protein